jgi:hypothetical protein
MIDSSVFVFPFVDMCLRVSLTSLFWLSTPAAFYEQEEASGGRPCVTPM